MTARPTSIAVGPFVWPIRYEAETIKTSARMDGADKFGFTRPERTDIIVDPDRSEQGLRETILHEAIHAAVWTYGIDCDHNDEESVVAPLASAILDIIRRNPKVLEFLLSEDE